MPRALKLLAEFQDSHLLGLLLELAEDHSPDLAHKTRVAFPMLHKTLDNTVSALRPHRRKHS
jgi:hypothetical protein